ncbi:MAG: DUF1365 domain-containing protein [Acidimicrobiales bacterium]
MTPGFPALCEGTVAHRRTVPAHEFVYPSSLVWLDPDDPGQLCDLHPAWSADRPAPVRFRRGDYGGEPIGSLSVEARRDLIPTLGYEPVGPVRMLSQLRRWGWLFNPVTFYFVWDGPEESISQVTRPVGVVLEVTNTPWKERIRYPLALTDRGETLSSEFEKVMHVSPFLGMDYRYQLSIQDRDDRIALDIDVVDPECQLVLHTALRLRRQTATRGGLGRSLRSVPLATYRVSAGIHAQAARLKAKGVPFVAHPRLDQFPTSNCHLPFQEEAP